MWVGGVGVLDDHLTVAEREDRARRPRGGEEADRGDRELPLEQDLPHRGTHLAGRPDHADVQAAGHLPVPPYTTASTSALSRSNAVWVAWTAAATSDSSTITE